MMSSSAERSPRWTVVIPTFNRSALLSRAVDSVMTQTFADFELLVVDDCSSDGTFAYLNSLTDTRIRPIHLVGNVGGAQARNVGIREARGTYLAFLDSDDAWLPTKLEQCERFADLVRVGSKWIGFHRTEVVYSSRTEIAPRVGVAATERVGDYLLRDGFIQTGSVFGPTHFIKKVEFGSKDYLDDWDFYMRSEEAGAEFRFLEATLARHYADTRTDRRSLNPSVETAEEWLQRYGSSLSPRSRQAFRLLRVAPARKQSHPWRARVEALLAAASLLPEVSRTWRPLVSILLRRR